NYVATEKNKRRRYLMYPKEERETVCVYEEETDSWSLYTCVRRHIKRLQKIFGEEGDYKIDREGEGRIIAVQIDGVDPSQVSFRNKAKSKELTEEQRKELSDRAKRNFGK